MELPADIANGIEPEAIAAAINECLRQQFVQSTIPTTAEALGVAAEQIRKATADFASNSKALGGAYRGAVKEACNAITDLRSLSSDAVSSTREAAQQLVQAFRAEYRWSLYTLTVFAVLMGIGIGMLFEHWLESPPQPADRTSVVQPVKPRTKP